MASVFIQWKGSDVCLDFTCSCGYGGHVDGDFVYAVRCPACGRVWMLPHTFELTEDTDGDTKGWATISDADKRGHAAGQDHAPWGQREVHPTGRIVEANNDGLVDAEGP